MFYDSPFQRISRPSDSIDRNRAVSPLKLKRPTNTYSITQDEKQVKMVVSVPGAKASDVNLDLNEDEETRTLRISPLHRNPQQSYYLTKPRTIAQIPTMTREEDLRMLGLSTEDDDAQDSQRRIRKAFLRLSSNHHPDIRWERTLSCQNPITA